MCKEGRESGSHGCISQMGILQLPSECSVESIIKNSLFFSLLSLMYPLVYPVELMGGEEGKVLKSLILHLGRN